MECYIDEKAGDKIIEGVEECHAVLHAGHAEIQIWTDDFEYHIGSVPASFTAEQINVVYRFYRKGNKDGIELGKWQKQREIQAVLGIKN